jgi:hypothetical protein
MKTALLLCAALLAAGTHARANDGFGGIGANGLEFAENDKVAMKSEDLFISPKKIAVAYVFENTSDEDVTGEVIFPLPPIGLQELEERDNNLPKNPDRENLVNFTVEVDGQTITPNIERRAVRVSPSANADDLVGDEDVTALLEEAGVPLTLEPDRLIAVLKALPSVKREKLVSAGLLDFYGSPPPKDYLYNSSINWAIAIRYHWNQTFPAGAQVSIRHEYENYPRGGVWMWQHPVPDGEWQQEIARRYCIDEETSKALTRCQAAYQIDYILRTANTWKGPIGKFKLTIDKGDPRNILSLCADGVKKTGPTTFVIEKTDYTPPEDLSILIATPGYIAIPGY